MTDSQSVAIIFEDTQDLVPKIPLLFLSVILVATEVFIVICCALNYTSWWQAGVLAVIFVIVFAFCHFVKIKITVDENNVTFYLLKPYTVPLDHVIDVKKGDIDILRNYSGWGIKKVKFRNYVSHGIDGAVSVKVTGRMVVTVTTTRPDELYDILIENRKEI